MPVKFHIVKALVFPVVLYGCATTSDIVLMSITGSNVAISTESVKLEGFKTRNVIYVY